MGVICRLSLFPFCEYKQKGAFLRPLAWNEKTKNKQ
jgi:hypothetical protein